MVAKQAQMDLDQVLKLLDKGTHILNFDRQAPTSASAKRMELPTLSINLDPKEVQEFQVSLPFQR